MRLKEKEYSSTNENLKSKDLKNQFLIKELLTFNFFKTELNRGAFEPRSSSIRRSWLPEVNKKQQHDQNGLMFFHQNTGKKNPHRSEDSNLKF